MRFSKPSVMTLSLLAWGAFLGACASSPNSGRYPATAADATAADPITPLLNALAGEWTSECLPYGLKGQSYVAKIVIDPSIGHEIFSIYSDDKCSVPEREYVYPFASSTVSFPPPVASLPARVEILRRYDVAGSTRNDTGTPRPLGTAEGAQIEALNGVLDLEQFRRFYLESGFLYGVHLGSSALPVAVNEAARVLNYRCDTKFIPSQGHFCRRYHKASREPASVVEADGMNLPRALRARE